MRKMGYIASGVLVGSSLMIATSAIAGGFAIREQSTTGLGVAFADSAAGSDLSSMFWNPAAVTVEDGLNTVSSYSLIIPDTDITPLAGAVGTNKHDLGFLGASYVNYQINQQLYVGMSVNSPFGLVTEAEPGIWAGDSTFRKSEMLTINAAPTVGYKVTPDFSVAVGLQIEYVKVRLATAVAPGIPITSTLKGDDIDVGFTLGALYKNADSGTSIGVGFRSSISHELDGEVINPFLPGGIVGVTAAFDTPEVITASIRQELSPTFAVMGNFEWSNWSRMKNINPAVKATGLPLAATPQQFLWKDSWFASIGAEMKMSEKFTGRAGVAMETTPTNNLTRTGGLPDSDRVWLNFGGSYKWSDTMTLDFAYSHIFLDDTRLSPSATLSAAAFAAVESSTDIISVGLRHKW